MTVEEIKTNIRYNENLVDEYFIKKKKIESDIFDLEKLRDKFGSLQSNFCERQQKRQLGLAKFTAINVKNKVFNTYYNGMKDLLNGYQFNNANDGLTIAKDKINKQIYRLFDELEECENTIRYRQGRIYYWNNELRKALAEQNLL